MRIVAATTNPGKAREIKAIVAGYPDLAGVPSEKGAQARLEVELVTLADVGLGNFDYEETGETFAENALGKALAVTAATGLSALADDSGLCVDALGGAPGVQSARWAGEDASDDDRIHKVLALMKGVPDEARTAKFVCAVAFAMSSYHYCVAEGICGGLIASKLSGRRGFGYDPIFFIPNLGKTLAELTSDEKNEISHRRAALAALIEPMSRLLAKYEP